MDGGLFRRTQPKYYDFEEIKKWRIHGMKSREYENIQVELLKSYKDFDMKDVMECDYIYAVYKALTKFVCADHYPIQDLISIFDAEDLSERKSLETFEEFIRESEVIKEDCVVVSDNKGDCTQFSLSYRIMRYHGYYYLLESPEGGGNLMYLFKNYFERG